MLYNNKMFIHTIMKGIGIQGSIKPPKKPPIEKHTSIYKKIKTYY